MKDERLFKLNFGEEKNIDCFNCGFTEFEGEQYTKRDFRDIDQLSVGETWHDPDKDLSDRDNKRDSLLRVTRLK